MIKCPFCQNLIEDDSRYCDQCGTALMFCPSCKQAKKGSSCPRCGELLIQAEKFHSRTAAHTSSAAPSIPVQNIATRPRLSLVGEGLSLTLKEGVFGRRGGIFPELSNYNFVSGTHGEIKWDSSSNAWTLTDLNSKNGCCIGSTRLDAHRPYILRAGMSVKIATLKFIVQ